MRLGIVELIKLFKGLTLLMLCNRLLYTPNLKPYSLHVPMNLMSCVHSDVVICMNIFFDFVLPDVMFHCVTNIIKQGTPLQYHKAQN